MVTYKNTADYAMDLHEFMRTNHPLDREGLVLLDSWAKHNPNFCLMSACIYAQPDKIRLLTDKYGADPHYICSKLGSDHHPGQIVQMNLLDETLSAYLYRPDVDQSPAGQARYAETVELLLKHGVSASLNADPYENPVRDAWLIAHPEAVEKNDSALADDWVLATFPPDFEGFGKLYDLIAQYQPEAVKKFEQLRESDNQRAAKPSSKAGL